MKTIIATLLFWLVACVGLIINALAWLVGGKEYRQSLRDEYRNHKQTKTEK
jgi:hypothetical protein